MDSADDRIFRRTATNMRPLLIPALALCSLTALAQDVQRRKPPVLGAHMARGAANPQPATAGPDMNYYGGPILSSTTIKAIFWGTGWSSPGDKISGLDKFYKYIGTSTGGGGTSYQA